MTIEHQRCEEQQHRATPYVMVNGEGWIKIEHQRCEEQ